MTTSDTPTRAARKTSPKTAPSQWREAPPKAIQYNPEWTPARHRLFDKWIPVIDGIPEDDEVVARLKDHLWDGDPLMDDVAVMFQRLQPGVGRKLFEQALEQGIHTLTDPPAELVALFQQLDRVPDWIDLHQVNRGARVAANIGTAGKAAVVFLNTILTVQGGQVGGVVGATGRMQRDVLQRARESAAFWKELPKTGGLSRFGDGFKTIVRVRLMHSQARIMLVRKWGDEWIAEYGNPIPNSGLVSGVPAFGIANLMYDTAFGKQYSRRDLEDIHMFWTYIGYVLGADEKILARTPEEGMKILNFALSIAPPPSQYADELNRVSNLLLDTMMNSVTFPVFDKQLKGYMLQAMNGFYFYVGGQFLARRITETEKPTLIGRMVPYAVQLGVRLSNLERFLPGKQQRHERNRVNGDPFWVYLSEQFDKLALSQNDTRKTRFNAHDQSSPEEIAGPWTGPAGSAK